MNQVLGIPLQEHETLLNRPIAHFAELLGDRTEYEVPSVPFMRLDPLPDPVTGRHSWYWGAVTMFKDAWDSPSIRIALPRGTILTLRGKKDQEELVLSPFMESLADKFKAVIPKDGWVCTQCGTAIGSPLTDDDECECSDLYTEHWVKTEALFDAAHFAFQEHEEEFEQWQKDEGRKLPLSVLPKCSALELIDSLTECLCLYVKGKGDTEQAEDTIRRALNVLGKETK